MYRLLIYILVFITFDINDIKRSGDDESRCLQNYVLIQVLGNLYRFISKLPLTAVSLLTIIYLFL